MINNLDISKINTAVDESVIKYATKKIGKLDFYMPRHARKSAYGEIIFKESKTKARKQYTVEVVLKLPSANINAKETTVNMYAAIDIVEEKLKSEIKRYKTSYSPRRGKREIAVRTWLGKIVSKKRRF